MTRAQLEAALRRAENAGDDESAEKLAVLLAPFVEADCERLDADPKAIVPAWGICA
jgi:hypothetical protein